MSQVAGRTGRGERGGRVLVQTFSPDHPSILAAVRHNYDAFARYELPVRESLGYPPFASMVRLVIRGPNQLQTRDFSHHLSDQLHEATKTISPEILDQDSREAIQSNRGALLSNGVSKDNTTPVPEVRILGPAPAPIEKLRGNYRFQIQAQSVCGDFLRAVVRRATDDINTPEGVQWIVDVDPLEML